MRNYRYKVVFSTGLEEEVRTCGTTQAKILAQAEQIKKGNQFSVLEVWCWNEGNGWERQEQ